MTTAVILAGGAGTRLRSAVPNLPKPLAPVRGRPFIEYQLDYWIEQGVDRFVISVGYKRELIMEQLGEVYRSTPLSYAIEDEPLGTGGGLLLAAQGLSEPFLVLNGDTYFEVKLSKLVEFHTKNSSDWTFSLFKTREIRRYLGIRVKPDGNIDSLKPAEENQVCLANGGVYLVNPLVLRNKFFPLEGKLSLEDSLLPTLANDGHRLFGIEFLGTFIDIGIPEDYFRAAKVLPQ